MMKSLIKTGCAALFLAGAAWGEKLPNPDPLLGSIVSRTQWSLNGEWKAIVDAYETGKGGFRPFALDLKPEDRSDRVEYSFDDSDSLLVPGDWNTQREKLFLYEGTVWYRKKFEVPADAAGKRLFLYFDGANYRSKVYLNGKPVGQHEGGFTPFNFDISDQLQAGLNTLVVGVSNRRDRSNIPSPVTDWYNYGGLIRDVRLVAVPESFVENFRIQLAKGSADEVAGWVQLSADAAATSVAVQIPELNVNAAFPVDANGRAKISGLKLNQLQRWSPENPKLYNVTVSAGRDSVTDRIGFRTIEVQGTKIVLNGKPVFLRGICLHDENAVRGGRAWSRQDAEQTLGWAKEMNCNFMRLAHYPHNENTVRLADEMGILLWTELPLYWGIHWEDDAVRRKAKQQFSEVINRDGNRAATIIWSICNETWPKPSRTEFLADVAVHVRSEDNTRLLSAALKPDNETVNRADPDDITISFSDPLGASLDIVSINEYVGWYGGLPSDCAKKDFKIHFDKPLLISEFGAGCKKGVHGDRLTRWSEEYQEWYYQEATQMFDKCDQLAGMSPWILVDFRSPLRTLPVIQDGWNRKGLISDMGEKKKAFAVMQAYYADKKKEAQ